MSDIELALNTGDKAESAPEKKEPRRQRNESKISIIFETKMFSLQELSPNYRHVFYKGLFSEFMVTFFFLFLVLAVDINCIRNAYEPLTTSIIVTVNVFLIALGLLYSFGHHGPNIDPVLTFSLLVGGKITLLRAAANFAMQLLASVLATLLLGAVFDSVVLSDGTSMSVAQQLLVIPQYKDLNKVFITEFLFSFALAYIVFPLAFDDFEGGSISKLSKYKFSFALSAALSFFVFVVGFFNPLVITFNPPRLFGPALVAQRFDYQWLYWVTDLFAGGIAALCHQEIFASALLSKGRR